MLECGSSNFTSEVNETRCGEIYVFQEDDGSSFVVIEETSIAVVNVFLSLVVERPRVFFSWPDYWWPDGDGIRP